MNRRQRLEWLLPCAGALCLIAYTVILSPKQPMWLDEAYTYYALNLDSLIAFLRSFHQGVNVNPPLYFVVTWLVSRIVPLSVMSLRIYSAMGSGVALLLIWKIMRDRIGYLAASVATLSVCLTSGLFLEHTSEARFYGLYIALVAWTAYNYDRMCVRDAPSRSQLLVNCLSHALAISCTYVALLYSFAILLSFLVRDRALRVWRPMVYASVLAGLTPLIVYFSYIRPPKSAINWISRPGATAVFNPFGPDFHAYFVLCAVAGVAAISFLRRYGEDGSNATASGSQRPAPASSAGPPAHGGALHLAILSFTFLSIPYALLLVSWTVLPLLLDRYALPTLIGVALLVGLVCSRLFADPREKCQAQVDGRKWAGIAENCLSAILIAAILAYPLLTARLRVRTTVIPPTVARNLAAGTVLAIADNWTYFPAYFESGENRRIFLMVPNAELQKFYLRYNSRLNPIVMDEFLATHDRFQIFSWSSMGDSFEAELKRRGGFRLQPEGTEYGKLVTVVAEK